MVIFPPEKSLFPPLHLPSSSLLRKFFSLFPSSTSRTHLKCRTSKIIPVSRATNVFEYIPFMQTSKHPENRCGLIIKKELRDEWEKCVVEMCFSLSRQFFRLFNVSWCTLRAANKKFFQGHLIENVFWRFARCCSGVSLHFFGVRVFVTAEHCPLILTINTFFCRSLWSVFQSFDSS